MTRGLSKSRLLAGLQCHRLLWWKVHEPGAEELVPEPEQQRIFDRGTEVGERARDYVPGGVLIESEGGDLGAMVRATQEAMEAGAPVIYEAAFSVDGVYVAVDILQRVDDGWCIIEVKSGTRVKDVHFQDVAVQIHVLERAGMRISGAEVMVLNRDCAAPRLEDLFSRHDVMQEARRHVPSMAMWAKEQIRMLGESNPTVETGGHCSSPYRCPFWDRCHESLPEHHVSSLYAARDRAPQWERQGIRLIEDIPDDVSLSPVQRRQVRAIRAGHMVVEKEPLARELASHPRPWGYLDFETIGLPIPRWDGCHPYDQVPTQFVYYERDGQAETHCDEWLVADDRDPRPELARHLVEACRGAAVVFAWYAAFEKRVISALARNVPELSAELLDLNRRIVDLLPVVRNHVYDPGFGGSFSLKYVLPTLVPELSYKGLKITNGVEASMLLEELMFAGGEWTDAERAAERKALEDYCRLDTFGMVELHDRLLELASEPRA